MEEITPRQKRILNSLIESYIDIAQPISSQFLYNNFKLGISAATIRNELLDLTEKGYLLQPHTSAGRIPTDKGYRFFVNELLEKDDLLNKETKKRECSLELSDIKNFYKIYQLKKDNLKFAQLIAKKMAQLSGEFSAIYLKEIDLFLKEGWEELMDEPEFKQLELFNDFLKTINNLESNLNNILSEKSWTIKIFIGSEMPFEKTDHFSMIVGKCDFGNEKDSILGILGPKRMPYGKNINLIKSLIQILNQ